MITSTERVWLIQHQDGTFVCSDGSGYPAKTLDPTQASDFSYGEPESIRRNNMVPGDKLIEYERITTMTRGKILKES